MEIFWTVIAIWFIFGIISNLIIFAEAAQAKEDRVPLGFAVSAFLSGPIAFFWTLLDTDLQLRNPFYHKASRSDDKFFTDEEIAAASTEGRGCSCEPSQPIVPETDRDRYLRALKLVETKRNRYERTLKLLDDAEARSASGATSGLWSISDTFGTLVGNPPFQAVPETTVKKAAKKTAKKKGRK